MQLHLKGLAAIMIVLQLHLKGSGCKNTSQTMIVGAQTNAILKKGATDIKKKSIQCVQSVVKTRKEIGDWRGHGI